MKFSRSPKAIKRAWSLYDWANSAYNLVITSTIFPVYYLAVTTTNGSDKVVFWGKEIINSALLNYALAFAYLIIAILSPILSSIADYNGNKKRFMQFFTLMGGLACCGLFFFQPERLTYGIVLSVIAAIGYCGSLVFYNAFLPEIAKPEEQNKLSAQGFAYGYVGSVLLQLVCLYFVFQNYDDSTFAPRLSFLLVGIWWLFFAGITFYYLPDGKANKVKKEEYNWLSGGFKELIKVAQQLRKLSVLKRFLPAFFFYSMGVQTVMLAATEYGSKEIKKFVNGQWINVEAQDLIMIILLIQLVAIGGAFMMAKLAEKIGNLKVLIITVGIWIAVCCYAYFIHTLTEFFILAIVVGIIMGGIQSLSRATYSRLMPETKDTTSFFSFYDVMEKLAIVLGMFSFGLMEHITGDMRNSIIALTVFFLLGAGFLISALTTNKNRDTI